MDVPIAVLDTCVLYPPSLRDTLLTLAEAGVYQPRWSLLILEELQRNLVHTANVPSFQAQRLLAIMQKAFPEALILEDFQFLIDSMTNHPKDRHVLAAAVASHAAHIVTFNQKDFPLVALQSWQVTPLTPDDFLLLLLNNDKEAVKESLIAQALSLHKPPKTLDEVLATLALHAPNFVAQIRSGISP